MANLLNIVNQQQTPIDEEKLKLLCSQQNVWGYFGLETEVSLALSEAKQLQMVRNFFEQMPKLSNSNAFNIDSSIGSTIRSASGLTIKKVIKSGDGRTEVTVETLNSEEKLKKSFNL